MFRLYDRSVLLTAMVLSGFAAAHGGTTAQTDLASIAVTPLTRQAGAKADWQTIYNYTGGAPPAGATIHMEGKWTDPPMRQDQSGLTFSFPNLPDAPEYGQPLHITFGYTGPLANYPTRATISYTSFFDQSMPKGNWSPFVLRSEDRGLIGDLDAGESGGKGKHAGAPPAVPLKVGDNTFSVTLSDQADPSVIMNGQDATGLFVKKNKGISKVKPGAMLLNGLLLSNHVTQFPNNKGDWFAVHAFKIEQMRPPLDQSSAAAIDLTVSGSEPVIVTIEVVDASNDSKGFVLREASVAPGKYRLYWDGIDQKSRKTEDSAWVGAGSYTFRLTTSKTAVHCVGEIDNSAPKYTSISYMDVNCFAVTMTPPGSVAPQERSPKWTAKNNADDTRKIDTADSVQCLTEGGGDSRGEWIASNGALINSDITSIWMSHGRDLAMTPPDPSDPTNPAKQFYFASQAWAGGNAVISNAGRVSGGAAVSKTLTSPDWNRTQAGFVPYQIKIGQLPAMLGPQHELFFETAQNVDSGKHGIDMAKLNGKTPAPKAPKASLEAEWVFRNVRFYEEGQPDPGPTTFDPSQFSVRPKPPLFAKKATPPAPLTTISETAPPVAPKAPPPAKPAQPIPPGTVTVEDNGHAVHLKDAPSINYPLNYNVTPHTIMAFDLGVIDKSKLGKGNGIGLSPTPIASKDDEASHYFDFMGGHTANDPRHGFSDSFLGAHPILTFKPNTLYTDSIPEAPLRKGEAPGVGVNFLFQPGFYGLKISEDGKFLFACNNADNRLEVCDISTDGRIVAKIPIDYPMFVTLGPTSAAGARPGTRFVYVDSPNAGLQRIKWNLSDNTFGKPETITPASEFAYPRGLVYNVAAGRIIVCDTFTMDRSKAANQLVVIDPNSGKVLSRFGKQGGVDPATGGAINEGVFTCPLTIDADSKGAVWVNDFYSCETRKYDFDAASNGFKLERRVMGPNLTNTSHFFWMPDAPPTQAWTLSEYFVRNEADFDHDGILVNQRATSATYHLTPNTERPTPHFSMVDGHVYATLTGQQKTFELVGDGWVPRFGFGGNNHGEKGAPETVETVARAAGLLAAPGQPPTDLDKAIAASGDPDWATRPWAWSDLNGDGKMEYTADNPEFKIAFNSDLTPQGFGGCYRSSDGAYVCANNDKRDGVHSLYVLPPQTVNGKPSYDWKNAKVIPCVGDVKIKDVLAQDGRFYVLRSSGSLLEQTSHLECYDESGKLLWTRDHTNEDLQNLQSMGDGLITVMDRAWGTIGPVTILTKDGDLVGHATSPDAGDCWASTALRPDPDTGYIGAVQVFKFTGLSTVKSAAATVNLSKAGL